MTCYHLVTHTSTQNVMMAASGGYPPQSSTYQVRVDSHIANETLNISSWDDRSNRAEVSNIAEYKMVVMDLRYLFQFDDDGYEIQKANFINAHKGLDLHYEFTELQTIEEFRGTALCVKDTNAIPFILSYRWYLLADLTFVMSLPFRMWLSASSGKSKHTIIKHIKCTKPCDGVIDDCRPFSYDVEKGACDAD
jgi:hypothetical protein